MTGEPLIAREGELAAIGEHLRAACAGAGRVVAIHGPPGIGKTRLVEAAVGLALEGEMTVLTARPGEFDRKFPFSVVRQLFERLVRDLEEADRTELLAGAAAHAAPALGLGQARAGPYEGEHVSGPIMHGLYWLAADLAGRAPLLLAVDDLQWADAPSLAWLTFLAARVGELPLLLLLAHRHAERAPEVEGEPDHEPLLALLDDPNTREIRPSSLGVEEVGRLVAEKLGEEVEPAFAEVCRTATGGNPFLVDELCRALTARSIRPRADSASHVPTQTTETVARSVRRRLREAGEPAAVLARAVAILGGEGPWRDAARLAGLDPTAAALAADRLAAVDVLVADGRLSFVHPMVGEAVYGSIPSGERNVLHSRAARAAAEEGLELDRVAGQLMATHPAGEAWVVEALRRAARLAVERGAPRAAADYLRRALDEPPRGEDRAKVLVELGAAEVRAGLQEGSQRLWEVFSSAREPALRSRTGLELGLALVARGKLGEAIEVLDAAIDEGDAPQSELALRLEADFLGAARLDIRSRPLVEKRLERLPREPSVRGARHLLLGVQALHAALAAEPAAEVARLGEAALAADLPPDFPLAHSPPLNEAAYALMVADHFEPAERFLAQALADARRRGSIVGFATASCWRSYLAFRRGALPEAEAEARSGLDAAGRDGWALGRPAILATLVDALVERGENEEADASLAHHLPDWRPSDSALDTALLQSRGRLRLAQAEPEKALEDFLLCGRRQEEWGAPNPALFAWRSSAALAHLALEERERAQELVEDEVALARRFGAPRALGIAMRVQAAVIGGRAAIRLLKSAAELLEGSPARLERAHALVDLGAAQRRGGQRVVARGPLRVGLDAARACGAHALAARAHTELLAAGGRPRRLELSGPASLTPSERRVADMAANGLTNREIAQALFVTQKTIEIHLRNSYRKLDINSRAELPEALGASEDPE
ncbi:MAG TPA: AAA family ATPase [Thermoleophilaceae bacterium]|nr:AAA family ATPase [Thermoleophilaceae bacterium]